MHDTKVSKKLKEDNPHLFKKLFKFSDPGTTHDSMAVHINPTEPAIVFVPNADGTGRAVLENVFICLSFSSEERENQFKEYFVSKQYNVNFASDS